MKLGGDALFSAFMNGNWQAFRGTKQIPITELDGFIGPNSIDVTLHHILLVPDAAYPGGSSYAVVDPRDPKSLRWDPMDMETDGDDGIILAPGHFVLGAVRERFVATNALDGRFFAPFYDGRSTCGRLGIASHVTAGFGDYGFTGAFTLELVNHAPYGIILRPGMRIGQVSFEEVLEPRKYHGAYSADSHNDGPVAPVLGRTRF